jgi:TetR/AcrR family transcriptional regulator, cholesterol catabolism regulator
MVWRPEPVRQGRQPAVVVQQDPPPPATASVPKSGVNPERWSEILDAAGQIFNEKGYQAARIEDIAGRVGILRGSLYYYIDSKEDLLYALSVTGHTSGLSTIAEDEATSAADAPTRLAGFIERWMAIMPNHPEYSPVTERDVRFLGDERRAIVMEMRLEMHGYVRQIFEQGIGQGDFDPSIDPGVAANSLFELLNGTIRWFRPSGRLSHTDVGEYYKRLVLQGVLSGAKG